MHVIPVIDVKNGAVVHAVGGHREQYAPITTPLSGDASVVGVVSGLLSVYPFKTLYIADLDGITGRAADLAAVAVVSKSFPDLDVWVDNGAFAPAQIEALLENERVSAVFGSETARSAEQFSWLHERFRDRLLLSLDFKGDAFLGPQELLDDSRLWPRTIIAMTLASVGARAGPDIRRVRQLVAAAPASRVIAAGGVRDRSDLLALSMAGASGALVATALHTGTLKAGDLDETAGLR